MPPIDIGPQSPAARPTAPVTPRASEAAPARAVRPLTRAEAPAAKVSLDPGAPPVDAERVSQIRKAIEQGTYPLLPTRVADAMIAAGVLLRTGK